MDASVVSKAAQVRMIVLDVDGVLTDGGLYYFEDGRFAVRFDVKDGLGLALAKREGLLLGLVSGRPTPQARMRAEQLAFDEIHLDVRDKGRVLQDIKRDRQLAPGDLAFMGDDLIDIAAMRECGFKVAVADAVLPVRDAADYVTECPGGRGAVRELVDLVLAARNQMETP